MKKFKIEIKNRWTGNVIFTYESEKAVYNAYKAYLTVLNK